MVKKLKLTVEYVYEPELGYETYEECETIEGALELDKAYAEKEGWYELTDYAEVTFWKLEIVEEKEG